MSSKWSWVFGIVTVAGLLYTFLFFLPTQVVTARDIWAVAIGIVFGALASGLIATFVFHGAKRTETLAANRAITQANTEAVVARNNKLTEIMGLIPTRLDRIDELENESSSLRIEMSEAEGHARSSAANANEARAHGWQDIFANMSSEAEQWNQFKIRRSEGLEKVNAELVRITSLSDDEWKQEQTRLRVVGSEDILKQVCTER